MDTSFNLHDAAVWSGHASQLLAAVAAPRAKGSSLGNFTRTLSMRELLLLLGENGQVAQCKGSRAAVERQTVSRAANVGHNVVSARRTLYQRAVRAATGIEPRVFNRANAKQRRVSLKAA